MITEAPAAAAGATTVTGLRPGHEGSNIGSWIGFKQINYLVEDAVREHLRSTGFAVRSLYEQYGLCFEIVDLATRINTAFHLDDAVDATITPDAADGRGEMGFKVSLKLDRKAGPKNAALSTVRARLRRDQAYRNSGDIPPSLRAFATDRVKRPGAAGEPVPSPNAFTLRSRVPYPYCHFTERMKMSGYLAHLEQAVDLFLADRGVSVKRLLDEQGWIPVVPGSRVSILDETVMEEEIQTVLTVERIFKRLTFDARMDIYASREGRLLRTATARITHGYAAISSRSEFGVVEFDDRLITALGGE